MGRFKDAYQDVQPVILRLAEESVTSSLYCSSAEGIEAHVSTLVEAFLVEVYRCRICQFTSSQKARISHHVMERHDPTSPCPHLPCLEKEDDESLNVEMSVDDEVDHNNSPYDLESDLHSGSKSNDDQMDMERMSFLLPMYGMFQNISPRSCDISLGSNSDGNLHVAQTCEVSTLFEEERHGEDSEEEPVFQLEDASTDLAVPLNSEIETEVQDEEMAQSAHLMTLGLCRISSTKCPPQSASSVKRLSHTPGEQDAENNIMDDRQPLLSTGEMQKPSEEDGGLVCILCQTVTSSRSMLEVHLKCHSGDQGFRCLRCDWESEDWLDMEQHWRGHGKKKGSKPHKCSVCPKAFRRADSRDAHEKRHNQRHRCRSEPTPLAQCSLCLEWCHSGKEWEIHQQCHFQGEFKCLHCDFTENSWKKTLKHIHTQHKQGDTNQKKQIVHSIEHPSLSTQTSTKYPECLKKMKPESWCQVRKRNMINRVVGVEMNNKGEKDRVRRSMDETSVGGAALRRREFCCNLCDKKFSTKLTMRRHMGIHQGEKPFKCPHCHYCTRLKASLIQHLRVHTGEKPYKCSQCSYASIDRSSLRRHSRTHTQERPYCCQFCSYSSIQKKSLDLHSRRHHTGESFPCHLCQYSSADRQLLVRHIKKHHSTEQPVVLGQRNSSCSGFQTAPSQRARTSK